MKIIFYPKKILHTNISFTMIIQVPSWIGTSRLFALPKFEQIEYVVINIKLGYIKTFNP